MTAEFEKFYVVTVYTPNAKDDLSRLALRFKHWDPAFLAYCKQLEKRKPVIFCGDLNVAHTELDLANPKPNRGKKGFTDEERAGFQNFVDAGFVDTFRLFTQGNGHYSWWSHFANSRARNIGWRIDYVLVSETIARCREERRDPSRRHGQRSLPGQHRSRCINPRGEMARAAAIGGAVRSGRHSARYRGGYRIGAEPHPARIWAVTRWRRATCAA